MKQHSKQTFSPETILPTKSGCLILSILFLMIGALAFGIFWTLMNVPPGS